MRRTNFGAGINVCRKRPSGPPKWSGRVSGGEKREYNWHTFFYVF
ncbi:hypothetical protein ACFO25_03280 [Paenactinomyces guangxiensis]|nr:hypothetical protein [Paenactinomyces guangxiensis]